jgi:hypothetical protein
MIAILQYSLRAYIEVVTASSIGRPLTVDTTAVQRNESLITLSDTVLAGKSINSAFSMYQHLADVPM